MILHEYVFYLWLRSCWRYSNFYILSVKFFSKTIAPRKGASFRRVFQGSFSRRNYLRSQLSVQLIRAQTMNTYECNEMGCKFYSFTKHGLEIYRSVVHKIIHFSKFTGTETIATKKSPMHKQGGKWLKLDRSIANNVKQFLTTSDFVSFEEEKPFSKESSIYPISAKRVRNSIDVSCKWIQVMLSNSEDDTNRNKREPFLGFENQLKVYKSQRDSVAASFKLLYVTFQQLRQFSAENHCSSLLSVHHSSGKCVELFSLHLRYFIHSKVPWQIVNKKPTKQGSRNLLCLMLTIGYTVCLWWI